MTIFNFIRNNTAVFIICILLILCPVISLAQQRRITGSIKSDSGGAVAGAAIAIKGKPSGAFSDSNGNFTITAAQGDVLVVSFIGHVTREVGVGTGDRIDIVLQEDTRILDDVVVVGYGTQKKINVTGAVSQLSGSDIESRPVTSIASALQGMVPGLNISVPAGGGELNTSLNVNIRGTGTIGTGSTASPLILIDGVAGDMNALNPQDIESISILKDAASAAVYGSRAPFGVILVTTKSGKTGKVNVSYSNNFRFSSAISKPEMLDSYKFAVYFNDGRLNAGQTAIFGDDAIARILAYQRGELDMGTTINTNSGMWQSNAAANANTDWYKAMYKDWSMSQDHSLSVNGGNQTLDFYISGNYLNQQGLLLFGNDNLRRYGISGKINVKVHQWVRLLYSTRYIKNTYDKPTYLSPYFYQQLSRRWPTNPVYDPNGFPMDGSDINRLENGGRTETVGETSYHQFRLTVTPIDGWNIYAEANLRPSTSFTNAVSLPVTANDGNGNPFEVDFNNLIKAGQSNVSEEVTKTNFYNTNVYTEYAKTVGDGHNVKVMAGFNSELNQTKNFSAARDSLLVASVPHINAASGQESISGYKRHWSTAGFFGRVNYNYKERYLVEFTGRYDGSSRFIGDKRWNFFPSASAGWNIAREDFWKGMEKWVGDLKFKVSWGQLGNQNTSSLYPFYATIPYTKDGGSWILNGKLTDQVNMPGLISTALTWETIESLNVGLDFGAFRNHLTGSVNYFNRKTNNMVGPAPDLPVVLGAAAPSVNNADMKSEGYEIELQWRHQIGKFRYGIRATLYDAVQTVTKYSEGDGSVGGWYTGKRMGEIWGFKTVGIAKTKEQMDAHLETVGGQSAIGSKWDAGDIMYADLDGRPGITRGGGTVEDHGDLMVVGNTTPRYQYGITIDFQYKGFDFMAFFQGVGKQDYNTGTTGDADYQTKAFFWGIMANQWQSVGYKEHWDYFRPEGHSEGANLNSYYPRPLMDTEKNHRTQTGYILNASYCRLKNIQIGYTIPERITRKAAISRLRVYMSGENLLTFTKLTKLYDPETMTGVSWGSGKTYPLSKVVSFGINLNF